MQLKKMVEGEYQTDSWPKGPETSLCPLARPEIAIGPEPQIEAWSASGVRRHTTPGSHQEHTSCAKKSTAVPNTGNRQRFGPVSVATTCLSVEGTRMSGPMTPSKGRYALDIPLHRRNLWGHSWKRVPVGRPIDPSAPSLCSFGRDDIQRRRVTPSVG